MAVAQVPTVGFYPKTFPRAPIDVNIYREHVLLGQVVEPLVTIDKQGSVLPAAARRWEISPDNTEITFYIDTQPRFSNGQSLTASDAKSTIERHTNAAFSQSKYYLAKIAEINAPDAGTLRIRLHHPYPAIFKALSREQLGILPQDWHFDPLSNEPFIGTGPYQAVKKSDGWHLVKNQNYNHAENTAIPEWRVIQGDFPDLATAQELPDLIPFISAAELAALKQNPHFASMNYRIREINHFMQFHSWWNPHGQDFQNSQKRKIAAAVVEELMQKISEEQGLTRATGFVPEGILGYSRTAPKVALRPEDLTTQNVIRIGVSKRDASAFDKSDVLEELNAKYNVKIALVPYELNGMTDEAQKIPDVVLFAFAGGFQDPEGFLGVVSGILKSDIKTVLGNLYDDYQMASQQTDEPNRDAAYKNLNQRLVESGVLVPGWKFQIYQLNTDAIDDSVGQGLRYSTQFMDYKPRKEVP